MQGVTAFWDYVRFFARESEAEAERFEADGTFVLVVCGVVRGYDGNGCWRHWSEWMLNGTVRVVGEAGATAREGWMQR